MEVALLPPPLTLRCLVADATTATAGGRKVIRLEARDVADIVPW